MRTKMAQKFSVLLCVFGMLLWILAGSLQIYVTAEDDLGSLTIISETEKGIILEGTEWRIYRVGGRNENNKLELQDEFRFYPVYLGNYSESVLSDAAQTLHYYTVTDKIEADGSGVADANGRVKFDALSYGLYLLVGDYVTVNGITYCYTPFFVELPSPYTNDLDLIARPKNQVASWPPDNPDNPDEPVEYTVKKIWENDEDMPELRTASITAEIYRDGVLFETVVLDESNDWTYSWMVTELHEWTIKEVDVPRDYAVSYDSDSVNFAIVNTYYEDFAFWEDDKPDQTTSLDTNTEVVATTTTDKTETIESTASTEQSEDTTVSASQTTVTETKDTTDTSKTTPPSSSSTVTTTVTTSDTEKLPQTGQLWWPVPLLVVAGLVSIAAGLKLRTKE